LNAIEQQQILAIIKALVTPALLFAIVAVTAFGFSIIKPEEILPAEVVGAQGSEEAILYSPEVLKKADSMEPNRLFAAGKLDQAMTKAYALAASKPYDVIANMAAGNVLVQSETEDVSQEGYRLLKRSVSLAPRSRYVRSNLAENLAKQKKFDEAIDQYQLIIQGFPRWAKPRLALANIYLTTDRPKQAADELAVAVDLEPNNGATKKLRGIALARAGQIKEGFDEYIMGAALEKIHQGLPEDLKQQLTVHGSLMKAENYYLQELRNRPDDVTMRYMLGRIYLYEERYAEAKARLLEARKHASSDADIRRNLSIVLKKLGEDSLATNEFMMSVKLEQAAEQEKREKENTPAGG